MMTEYTIVQTKNTLWKLIENYNRAIEITDKAIDFRMSMLDLGLDSLKNTEFADRIPRLKMHYQTEEEIFKKWKGNILPQYIEDTHSLELMLEYQKNLHPDIISYFRKFSEQKALFDIIVAEDVSEKAMQDILFRIKDMDIDPNKVMTLENEVLKGYLDEMKKNGREAKIIMDTGDPLRCHLYIKSAMNNFFLRNYSLFNIKDNFDVSNYHPGKYLKIEGLESLLLRDKYIADEKYSGIRQTVKLKNGKDGKVRSILKLDDRGIFLKYMTFGLFGNKKDIVLRIDPDGDHKILHIENDIMQIKNYNDGENKLFIEDQVQHPLLTESELSKFNDVELFYKDGRLNLAAIGGEGLLYTVDFIMKNYDKIRGINHK